MHASAAQCGSHIVMVDDTGGAPDKGAQLRRHVEAKSQQPHQLVCWKSCAFLMLTKPLSVPKLRRSILRDLFVFTQNCSRCYQM